MLSLKEQSYIDHFTPSDWYVLDENEINDFIVNLNLLDKTSTQIMQKCGVILSYLTECRRDADHEGRTIIARKKEITRSICEALTM